MHQLSRGTGNLQTERAKMDASLKKALRNPDPLKRSNELLLVARTYAQHHLFTESRKTLNEAKIA